MLKIAAVSYLNTFPFVYGIQHSGLLNDYKLELAIPSLCAEKLYTNEVDVALVPVGAIPSFPSYQIVTDYCIGAVSKVKTVLLLSQKPLDSIQDIYLDFDSRTSVQLVQVLAREFWKIQPKWHSLKPGQIDALNPNEAVVAIGDKTFEMVSRYPYIYDLAEEWIRCTNLPFVFAAWMSLNPIDPNLVVQLNQALQWGVDHKKGSLEQFKEKLPRQVDCLDYLERNISFHLDHQKRAGMNLFLDYLTTRSF